MASHGDIGPVLITGCSSGLGRASAIAFQERGHLTVATARDLESISDLERLGCRIAELDVADEASRAAAVHEVESRFGAVGVLVNNAAGVQYGPLEEVPIDELRRSFETNVFGPARLVQLVVPGMRAAGRGRIVDISSVSGRVSMPGGGVYHMTKFALEAFADAVRPELKRFGIDVVNVLPGPFVSRFREKLLGSIAELEGDGHYRVFKRNLAAWMGRFLEPGRSGVMSAEHVARAVLRAATTARPRTRYSVGYHAKLGPLGRRCMPDRVVDAILARRIPHE